MPKLLQQTPPFIIPMATKLTHVKDIPYFVTNKFVQTLYRDRYQLAQVERLVERSYKEYLINECETQRGYKKQLQMNAKRILESDARERALKKAAEFELSRCTEFEDLFPPQKMHAYQHKRGRGY